MTKDTDSKDQAASSRPGPSSSRGRNRTALWIVLALALGLAGGFLLSRQFPPAPAPPAQNATAEAPAKETLAHKAQQADAALRDALKTAAPQADSPKVETDEERTHAGQTYRFKSQRLPQLDKKALHDALAKELTLQASGAKLLRAAPDAWEIVIDGATTHRLTFQTEPAPTPDTAKRGTVRLAIVIDDMGEDAGLARELAKLGVPVTFSIWPDSGRRTEVLKIAKDAGREIFIHLPMQPKGYPKVAPGPHALLVGMTAEQIAEAVRRAVKRVPGALAINNHMGSEFTESTYAMRAALATMKAEGLYFVDSRTTAKSVGIAEAKRLGMRVHQRDVFLDNELSVPAIVKQLQKAEATARQHGHAIAIGHPHRETVDALRAWLKNKDTAVQVVTVSSLPPM